MSVVVFDKVSFIYENEEVLKDISFDIDEGDIITIVGPNGGGKTTLLKLILGLLKPSKGKVIVYGNDPVKTKRFIGYLPQFSSVKKDIPITVYEFVKISLYKGIFKKISKEDEDRIKEILNLVNALNFRDKLISELSGGQFQRVLLARALVNDPKLLILDEPTNFIDENNKRNFYEIIHSFVGKKTIIIVSHDLNMVVSFTKRVFCLNREMFINCKVEELGDSLEKIYENFFSYVGHKH